MKIFNSISLCLLSLLAFSLIVECQTDSWRDIKIMTSTRSDVSRILKQKGDGSIFEIYSIKNATIDISYSYGKCTDELNSGWNIPENVVIELNFTPLTDVRFSSFQLDLTKFRKIQESPHVPEIVTYINTEEGVKFVVQKDGLLSSIGFFPSSRYGKLRCRENYIGWIYYWIKR